MYDALDNLLRQPVNDPLNPLFFQRVKKELRELLEEHREVLLLCNRLVGENAELRLVKDVHPLVDIPSQLRSSTPVSDREQAGSAKPSAIEESLPSNRGRGRPKKGNMNEI